MGVQQPTHYHVADNSTGFRDWLDKKKVEWMPYGHFTTIQLEGNDIFKLGLEFGLYRKEAMSAPAKAVEAISDSPDDIPKDCTVCGVPTHLHGT
jgi:hypothetical protein